MDWDWASDEKAGQDENPSSREEEMFDHMDRQVGGRCMCSFVYKRYSEPRTKDD